MSLTLTNIPRIMYAQGWTKGATLLAKWFRRAATRYPSYTAPDTTTITLDWVLRYPQAKSLYDSIFANRIWANDKARQQLAKRLKTYGKLTGFEEQFDQTQRPVTVLESEYINYRAYGGGYSGYSGSSGYSSYAASGNASTQYSELVRTGLNDLIAALGAFTYRVVVGGSVVPIISGGYEVTITKVGVFLRDSFDFEGFQFLGFWDDSLNAVSAVNPFVGTPVFNSSFRDYRDEHHFGGDFLVFSDMKITHLNPPQRFNL